MSSRDDILRAIRQNLPQSASLPSPEGPWIQFTDPVDQFRSVLESVGGRLECVETLDDVLPALGELVGSEKVVASTLPEFEGRSIDLASITDPHDLKDVDLAILSGSLAVAENAAIWVDDQGVDHRVLYFLSQHLSLVVPRAALVHNMHEAYQRITPEKHPFGSFISGPSKTADIEQSLVIGAHGARTLTVFFVDSMGE